MVLVPFAKRRQMLHPLIDVFDEAALIIVDVHARGDVHGRNQYHTLLHSALANDLFYLRRDMDVGAMCLGMKLQVFRKSLHSLNSRYKPALKSYRSASATLPLAIRAASRAKSAYITRSFSIVAHTDRIAACAACPRFEVFSGARKSSAWATAIASIASTFRVLSTTRFSLVAAVIPIET